ncbi:MAG: hypothetical protein ACI8XV_002251 [Arenicella sp.]|jgi:hypothetical protein
MDQTEFQEKAVVSQLMSRTYGSVKHCLAGVSFTRARSRRNV